MAEAPEGGWLGQRLHYRLPVLLLDGRGVLFGSVHLYLATVPRVCRSFTVSSRLGLHTTVFSGRHHAMPPTLPFAMFSSHCIRWGLFLASHKYGCGRTYRQRGSCHVKPCFGCWSDSGQGFARHNRRPCHGRAQDFGQGRGGASGTSFRDALEQILDHKRIRLCDLQLPQPQILQQPTRKARPEPAQSGEDSKICPLTSCLLELAA